MADISKFDDISKLQTYEDYVANNITEWEAESIARVCRKIGKIGRMGKKDTCKNYNKKCSKCWANSSIYDTHPFYTSKDLVEVVRCKDCKWYREGEILAPNKFCFRLEHPTEDRKIGYNYAPDDFCSYGKIKEGAE